ncbi:MAG: hypothetical protein ACTSR2_00265 [Candidatus Hodarchaeales archaeon]
MEIFELLSAFNEHGIFYTISLESGFCRCEIDTPKVSLNMGKNCSLSFEKDELKVIVPDSKLKALDNANLEVRILRISNHVECSLVFSNTKHDITLYVDLGDCSNSVQDVMKAIELILQK